MNRLIFILGFSIFSGYLANLWVKGNTVDATTTTGASNTGNAPETTDNTRSTTPFVVDPFPGESFAEIKRNMELQLSDHKQHHDVNTTQIVENVHDEKGNEVELKDVNNTTQIIDENVEDENEVEVEVLAKADVEKAAEQIISENSNAHNDGYLAAPLDYILLGIGVTLIIICIGQIPVVFL